MNSIINGGSTAHKKDELWKFFLGCTYAPQPHIIGISETWLKPYISAKKVEFENYRFFTLRSQSAM